MFDVDLNWEMTVLFRITLAILLAFIPGMERELTGKFAGLRTHILVCLGACVFTILSIQGFKMHFSNEFIGTNDPARIAAQVITGIGFIGAGSVMRHGTNISGITTAATLWVCAAIGMSCGCGAYVTAIFASFATLIVLISIRKLEQNVLSKRKVAYILYEVNLSSSIDDCDTIENIFQTSFHKVYKFKKKLSNNGELKFGAVISTKKSLKDLNTVFKSISGINSIEIGEWAE
ncbi:MgtC/SapB family protein [bacterium]|nr:MgtC/SapB family protein [bacterium]